MNCRVWLDEVSLVMRSIRSLKAMQRQARDWHREGVPIGFVPTMGCLHAGHLSLVAKARQLVGPRGVVVLSIYVIHSQFGPAEDFARYPRPLAQDTRLCRQAGVNILFLPSDREMYPGKGGPDRFSTFVVEEKLSLGMEGASRPTHFRGVTTVVSKLLNLVQPDVAVFGQKDYQQAALIKRMVRDLNFPVRLVVAPTVRESDGLAMSSRNRYLSPEERRQAPVLWKAIKLARRLARAHPGGLRTEELEKRLASFIAEQPHARVDYIAFFGPDRLDPVERAGRGTHLALAVWLGKTRLIDNGRL